MHIMINDVTIDFPFCNTNLINQKKKKKKIMDSYMKTICLKCLVLKEYFR